MSTWDKDLRISLTHLLLTACLMVGAYHLPSCGTTGPVTTAAVQSYSVDREVFLGLWNPVVARAERLCAESGEDAMLDDLIETEMAVAAYSGDIPFTAAHQVDLVCDIHDLAVLTDPNQSPYYTHHLRSTELLRKLFEAASEPLITQ